MMECMGRIIMKNNLRYFPPPEQATEDAEGVIRRLRNKFGGNDFETNFSI